MTSSLRPGTRPPLTLGRSPCARRCSAIHAAPNASRPSSRSLASRALRTGWCSGFVIAVFMPAIAAIVRNAASMPWRSGMPNEMFEAPQLTFTPSSSRISRTVSNIAVAASPAAPIGIVSGSMMTSSRDRCRGRPRPRRSCGPRRAAPRGSIEMPSSSLAMPITAAPNRFTSGSSRSSECSSAVTELISTLPWASGTAASSASGVDESMHSGTSTTSCTAFTTADSIAGSSNPGMPAFRSSTRGAGLPPAPPRRAAPWSCP